MKFISFKRDFTGNNFNVEMGIGSLEQCATRFVRELEKRGFETELDVYRSGRQDYYSSSGSSYVKIDVERESDDLHFSVKIGANGYGDVKSWTEIKRIMLAKIAEESEL